MFLTLWSYLRGCFMDPGKVPVAVCDSQFPLHMVVWSVFGLPYQLSVCDRVYQCHIHNINQVAVLLLHEQTTCLQFSVGAGSSAGVSSDIELGGQAEPPDSGTSHEVETLQRHTTPVAPTIERKRYGLLAIVGGTRSGFRKWDDLLRGWVWLIDRSWLRTVYSRVRVWVPAVHAHVHLIPIVRVPVSLSGVTYHPRDCSRCAPYFECACRDGSRLRFCRKCQCYKPDRAHHCRKCKRCACAV
jgi:hypothetical protein